MFAQEGEQGLLGASPEGVVVSLIHAGLRIALPLADVDELLHFRGAVVREPELLVFSLFDALVHGLRRVLEGRLAIRHMEKVGLYGGGLEGSHRARNALGDLGRLVGSGRAVAHLGVDGEPRGGPD